MAIDLPQDGAVATIRINRPDKLNALTLAMYEELGRAFAKAAATTTACVSIVLTGAGERAFCVGADLDRVHPGACRADTSTFRAWDPAHLKVAGFYKPIVCAVRGLCLGGGFEIMLATDIRIAAQTMPVFQLPEPTHGFVPAGGTLVRLVRQIGYAHAMEIMLTASRFTAAEMAAEGVINQVVEPDPGGDRQRSKLAQRIASLSPTAVQTIKEAALTLQDLPLAEAFRAGGGARPADLHERGCEAWARGFRGGRVMIVESTPHTCAGRRGQSSKERPAALA